MNTYTSPVPIPALDATAPEVYREIYGMPMFVTIPAAELAVSKDFWIRGLGFIDLFSAPGGQVTHLRRWAFQDVLLVPGVPAPAASAQAINFAAVLSQLDEIAARCSELVPGCVEGPEVKPWNSVELTVTTPENARVTMTAARPLDPASPQAENLRKIGIPHPADKLRA
ncbi:VOC family protein [Kribbella sp. NPDC050820]|uniref:VOC family protein n=1 Tax=Kribbella sp. NPDC050820 TaxID=3155408 RepID=UPI0033D3C66B